MTGPGEKPGLKAWYLTSVFALVGLIIGFVISQQETRAADGSGPPPSDPDAASRLKELDRLRAESLITPEEYEQKRKDILADL